ncbi:sporulation protein YjcZ [Paenibacillus glycanilyticus]
MPIPFGFLNIGYCTLVKGDEQMSYGVGPVAGAGCGYGGGSAFGFILVLFILLVIIIRSVWL